MDTDNHMAEAHRPHRWTREGLIWAFAFALSLSFGLAFTGIAVSRAAETSREMLWRQALRSAMGLDRDVIRLRLADDAARTNSAAHAMLARQFASLCRLHPEWASCYLATRDDTGVVRFAVFAQNPGIHTSIRPGQIWAQAPRELQNAFLHGAARIAAPHVDEWGEWVSVFVPLADPSDPHVRCVFGAELTNADFMAKNRAATTTPLAITAIMLALLLGVPPLCIWRSRHPHQLGHLFFATILVLGFFSALLLYRYFQQNALGEIQLKFAALAERKAEAALMTTHILCRQQLAGLASYIADHDPCATQEKFGSTAFNNLLRRYDAAGLIRHWGYLRDGNADPVDIRTGGTLDGLPVRLLEPIISSRPAREGLVLATEPFRAPGIAPGEEACQLVIHRITDTDASSTRGWIIGLFEPSRFLRAALLADPDHNEFLRQGLFMIDPATGRGRPLAGDRKSETLSHEEMSLQDRTFRGSDLIVQPIMAFGNSYAVSYIPNELFFAAYGNGNAPAILAALFFLLIVALACFIHGIDRRRIELGSDLADETLHLRQTLDSLREANNRYTALVASVPGAVYRSSPEAPWLPTFISDGVATVTGYPAKAFRSRQLDFSQLIDPAILPRLQHTMLTTAQGHQIARTEFPITAADGTTRHVINIATASFGPDGKITSYDGVIIDDTARHVADAGRNALREQLDQAARMESIGRLAGGIAHDFNNMLQAILGYTEMALLDETVKGELREDLETVRDAARRGAELTGQLLLFSRKRAADTIVVNVNDSVSKQLVLLRRLVESSIPIDWQPAARDAFVRIGPGQLDQIVMNLVVNARDALEGRPLPHICIGVTCRSFASPIPIVHATLPPGSYVLLSVHDNGIGIPADQQAVIFEPFFTTKDVGHGTGLGLATVYGVTRANGGGVRIESRAGLGTTFEILLPSVASPSDARPPAPATEPALPATPARARPGESVLVVDDEPAIATTAGRMLEALGYRVFIANSATTAEQLFTGPAKDVSLLLSDVVMPDVSGPELLARLRHLRPGLRALFMTGYMANFLMGIGPETLIGKPFSAAELAAKVRQALDAPQATDKAKNGNPPDFPVQPTAGK